MKDIKIKLHIDSKTGQANVKKISNDLKKLETSTVAGAAAMKGGFGAAAVSTAYMGAAVTKTAKALSVSNKELQKYLNKTGQLTKNTNKATKATKSFTKALKNNKLITGAAVTIGVALAYTMAKTAAQAEQQEKAFANLAASHGANSNKIIADLKRLSANTIDTMSLIEKSGTAMMMGIDPTKLAKLMEIAKATSKVTGQSVAKAFDDISLAVGRQSKMVLDNLGIIISQEEANENYAKVLNKSAKSLTDVERKQAFLNETLRKGDDLVKRIGITTESSLDKFEQFEASAKDLKVEFGKLLLVFTPIINGLTKIIKLTNMALNPPAAANIYFQREVDKMGGSYKGTEEQKMTAVNKALEAVSKRRGQLVSSLAGLETPGMTMLDPKLIENTRERIERLTQAVMDLTMQKAVLLGYEAPEIIKTPGETTAGVITEEDKEKAEGIRKLEAELSDEIKQLTLNTFHYREQKLMEEYRMHAKVVKDKSLLEQWLKEKSEEIAKDRTAFQLDELKNRLRKEGIELEKQRTMVEHFNEEYKKMTMYRYDYETEKLGLQVEKLREAGAEEVKIKEWVELRKKEIEDAYALEKEKGLTLEKGGMFENFNMGMKIAIGETKSLNTIMQQLGQTATEAFANNISANLANFISGTKSAKEAWKDFAQDFIKQVAHMVAKLLIMIGLQMILNALMGGGGSGGGAASGGGGMGGGAPINPNSGNLGGGMYAMANGGPTKANQTYLVGEKGPELFMSKSAGKVIPNDALGTDVTINVINNSGQNVSAHQQSDITENKTRVLNIVLEAVNTDPVYGQQMSSALQRG